MRKILFVLLMIVVGSKAFAQIEKPVTWSFAIKKTSNTEAVVYLKATIQSGWHIYSSHLKEGGPVKTSFNFKPSSGYALNGKIIEPVPLTKFEKVFNMDVSYFEKSVVFQQKIKLKTSKGILNGTIEYMVCNQQKCLPPTNLDFSINL
jgi:DsbC/DsbD-like thiol-disulfide interchange protein